MSKLTKLLLHPVQFFRDATKKKVAKKFFRDAAKEKVAKKENLPSASRALPDIPNWFQGTPGPELQAAIRLHKPIFLYLPWIAEHGNLLVSRIGNDAYQIAALDMIIGVDNVQVRRAALRFAREQPHLYRRLVVRRLVPLRGRISAMLFTLDWPPVMRIVASVCEELEIPRILIPHESVFIDRDKYYCDPISRSSMPVADLVLGWGDLQRDIFIGRGYPADRFIGVGAPKFDPYHSYHPLLSRVQFHRLFGLDSARKTILFAAQPMDAQLDTTKARAVQCEAIVDLLAQAEQRNIQLLVRLPPAYDGVLTEALTKQLEFSSFAAMDGGVAGYLVPPEEALYHTDIVTSINSTMLFEGLLLGRPALSLKYVDFTQIWDEVGIPAVRDKEALTTALDDMLDGSFTPSPEGMHRATQMFSCGAFDGKASERIRAHLTTISRGPQTLVLRPSAIDRLLSNDGSSIDVLAIPSREALFNGVQRYLPELLKARTLISSIGGLTDMQRMASADAFVQWGITHNDTKDDQARIARALGRPMAFIEDGFIRSVDIGLSGEPTLSIIIDDTTAYYDATRPSRLQRLLQYGPELTTAQAARARTAIDKIVRKRVSKFNHAPDAPLPIGTPGKRKLLLIDQRYGDQSIKSGLADESTFEKMLSDALHDYPDCDVIVKQHPDAIKGGKSSYFSNERLASLSGTGRVFPITHDINPHALFDTADEVFVATSGMGFEALMAGKPVRCYGVPFYAGWGATQDEQQAPERGRKRSVEEIFHFAYIVCSRYYHPERNETVEVEELVDYIAERRDAMLSGNE